MPRSAQEIQADVERALRAAAEAEGLNPDRVTEKDAARVRRRYLADNPELAAESAELGQSAQARLKELYAESDPDET